MKTVIFRADSSSSIGTGHIMRDLILAEREFSGWEIIFAVRELEGNINEKISQKGYEVCILDSKEIIELAKIAKKKNAHTIVIDHYDIGKSDEKKLKQNIDAKIFVLDDLYHSHCCDIILNHNIYAEKNKYLNKVPDYCDIRCGMKYTLLREEFYKIKRHFPPLEIFPTVFVAMGGSDSADLTRSILEILKKYPTLNVDVVTTSANRNLQRLKDFINHQNKKIRLHIDSDEIALLMARSHFSIVTPSVLLNEIYFLQKPFIAIKTASNQKYMAEFARRSGWPVLDDFSMERLDYEVNRMLRWIEETR